MSLELKSERGRYTGSIHFGDQVFPVTAKESGGALEGAFQSEGQDFAFKATLKSNALTFTTADTTYTLQRQKPANPLARSKTSRPTSTQTDLPPQESPDAGGASGAPPDAVPDEPVEVFETVSAAAPDVPVEVPADFSASAQPVEVSADVSATARTGKIFRHPLGFNFGYPEGWKVQEAQGGLQLFPPDLSSSEQSPEAYLVTGESAQGITSPDDPQVLQYFDNYFAQVFPFLKRKEKTETIKVGNTAGICITWEGQSPKGFQARVTAYVIILKGYAIGLIGLGAQERVQARDATLREMFSTFGFGEGQKDPRIVGAWRYEHYYSTKDFSSTSIRTTVLRADGTFSSSGQTMANATHKDGAGDTTGSTMVDTGESAGDRGRWGAAAGKLYLMWDDGSFAEYNYRVEGQAGARSILLVTSDGKKQLWEEVR